MKATPVKISNLIVLLFAVIFQLSCSKDTDLLADYIIADAHEAYFVANMAIDDYYVVAKDSEVVLDVLSNDSYKDPDKVKIVNVSQPQNGTVVVNEDKTITYIPNKVDPPSDGADTAMESTATAESEPPQKNETPEENDGTEEKYAPEEESTTESFSYTAETLNDNQTTETTEAKVNISTASESNTTPYGVDYYVTTKGTVYNDGRTEATAWSIERAFQTAKAGDVVAIKAGNYGNRSLVVGNAGTKDNPIRFIGYTDTPGDLVSDKASTFVYGNQLDSRKMPLLRGFLQPNKMAIEVRKNNVEIHNFQIRAMNLVSLLEEIMQIAQEYRYLRVGAANRKYRIGERNNYLWE